MDRLNPLNDYAFKQIMDKENLIPFLNAVLNPDDQKKLVSLELLDNNKELIKEMIFDKTGRLDIRAKTADGMQIDIEVQINNQKNMDKRTLFYLGKLFLEGIKQGEDYIKLAKVITVNILDFDYLDIPKFHSQYHLWEDDEEYYLLTDLIEVHFIELPKFKRFGPKDLRGNPLHRWLEFFDKTLPEEELKELMEMDSAIKRAEKKLEYISSDEDALALYRAREDSVHERANLIYTGRMEGVEEVAKKMLAKNMSLDLIAEITGLSIEEIKALQAECNKKNC
ncbi:MAG TPA: Rpn family recombination-promoting nuclease/putative transposase [Bacillota bacterium]|nr:Rpn family recombination-promoting nuclease/putative transposase [Bacillota bacterium]